MKVNDEMEQLIDRATGLARGLTTEQRFGDFVASIVRSWNALCLDNVGITIELEETYRAYAETLTNPSDFTCGCEAIVWWDRGGIVGWWRHGIGRYLSPHRYSEMRKWQKRGRKMKQQAFMDAVLSRNKEGKTLIFRGGSCFREEEEYEREGE